MEQFVVPRLAGWIVKSPPGAWMFVTVAAALNWKFRILFALCPVGKALKLALPRVNSDMLAALAAV